MNRRIKKKLKKRGNIFKYKKYKSIKRLANKMLLIIPLKIYTLNGVNDWEEMGKIFEDLFYKENTNDDKT